MNSKAVDGSFRTTRWSLVTRAAGADDVMAADALAALCEAYWYPLYAYFRRSGKSSHDAEDLTQSFFARLLTNATLATANPERGKLRTFLLACARNFLINEHQRAGAQKRGATAQTGFDAEGAERRYAIEPVNDLSPDRLFQRRWALSVLEHSLQLLGEEFAAQGKAEVFAALRPFLGFRAGPGRSYEEIAAELGVPAGTLKNQVFRLRERWRALLFEQVAATLDDPTPEEIREELKELFGCV
jgi:RNA polymerase sigma factor (sigma-70 family)